MTLFGIFGAGGCGRGILPLVRGMMKEDQSAVFVDDNQAGRFVNGAPVLTRKEFCAEHDRRICIAIADPATRRRLDSMCRADRLEFFSVRAENSIIMDDVSMGEGALLSPFTTITSNVRIGSHFHLNIYSYVEHDCRIGDFVTFAPSVRCNGNVMIGDGAYIGSNAVIKQGLQIGAGAVVGMGAVVTRDVPPGETWVGSPARPLKG